MNPPTRTLTSTAAQFPKILGKDQELGGVDPLAPAGDLGLTASREVIGRIPGIHAGRPRHGMDHDRRFFPENGAGAYVDHAHAELTGAECRSAFDLPAMMHALYAVARGAARAANENRRNKADWIRLYADNTDGHGNSHGAHCNFALARPAFDKLCQGRRLNHLLWVASCQVSSIIFTGSGKVGGENGSPPCAYQICARADFYECLASLETTFCRPLVNLRDEPHADPSRSARLHVIFFDAALHHHQLVLAAGMMQLVLAMLETGDIHHPSLLFEEPLAALHAFSRAPDLTARGRTLDGRRLTALEHQSELWQRCAAFVDRGLADGIVPDPRRLLDLWAETLQDLAARNWPRLERRLGWVAKRKLIDRLAATRGLRPDGAEARVLDHMYADLESGLYFQLERLGEVDRLTDDAGILQARREPPADTRAYLRAHCLRALARAGDAVQVCAVNWDRILFRRRGINTAWFEIALPDPSAGRPEAGDLSGLGPDEILTAAGARRVPPRHREPERVTPLQHKSPDLKLLERPHKAL